MNSKILGLLAVVLLAGPLATRAAMITELFQVTLPYASGGYSAGHVFEFTVTYDSAGTVMHKWNDGLNGVAQFGSGDDTLSLTYNVASYLGNTLFSDAQVSISGLAALPAGSTPRDEFSTNVSFFYNYLDPATNGNSTLQVQADNLYILLIRYGSMNSFYSQLYLAQYYRDAAGYQITREVSVDDVGITSRTAVPEPGTLALLGLGLAGLGLSRRRKA